MKARLKPDRNIIRRERKEKEKQDAWNAQLFHKLIKFEKVIDIMTNFANGLGLALDDVAKFLDEKQIKAFKKVLKELVEARDAMKELRDTFESKNSYKPGKPEEPKKPAPPVGRKPKVETPLDKQCPSTAGLS